MEHARADRGGLRRVRFRNEVACRVEQAASEKGRCESKVKGVEESFAAKSGPCVGGARVQADAAAAPNQPIDNDSVRFAIVPRATPRACRLGPREPHSTVPLLTGIHATECRCFSHQHQHQHRHRHRHTPPGPAVAPSCPLPEPPTLRLARPAAALPPARLGCTGHARCCMRFGRFHRSTACPATESCSLLPLLLLPVPSSLCIPAASQPSGVVSPTPYAQRKHVRTLFRSPFARALSFPPLALVHLPETHAELPSMVIRSHNRHSRIGAGVPRWLVPLRLSACPSPARNRWQIVAYAFAAVAQPAPQRLNFPSQPVKRPSAEHEHNLRTQPALVRGPEKVAA